MKNMLKLALPVGLAVVAGGLNYLALQQKTFDYVSIKEAIPSGERFPPDNDKFDKFTVNKVIPGAILWDDRGVLHNGVVPHSLEAGDVLLLRDIAASTLRLELGPKEVAINISLDGVRFEPRLLRVGARVGFAVRSGSLQPGSSEEKGVASSIGVSYEVLGPFRIVSLADQVRDSSRYGEDSSSRAAPASTISVARSLNDGDLLDGDSSRLIEANRTQAIGAVVLYPELQPPRQQDAVTE